MIGSPTSRRAPLRSAAWAFLTCLVHFSFVGARVSPLVCIRTLGGVSPHVRPQSPTEFVFWYCTIIPEVWALASFARQPVRERLRLFGVLTILFVSGSVSNFSETFAWWAATLVVSCVAHALATLFVVHLFRAAYAQSKDSSTQSLVSSTTSIFVIVWYSFPVWWLVGQFAIVSPEAEQVGWRIVGFIAKVSASELGP